MQVFKAYFKVVNNRKGGLLIFFFIFLLIALSVTNALNGVNTQAFDQTKNHIAVFSEESTPLSDGLKDYLNQNAVIENIADNAQDIQDALFYGRISYILRIPKGFTESFTDGSNAVSLRKTASSMQAGSVYMDLMINRYLNTAQLYVKNMPGASMDEIVSHVSKDMDKQATVVMHTNQAAENTNFLAYYFQYLGYAIIAIMIMGTTTVMMAFTEADLQNRNTCSPMKPVSFNMQIFAGNLAFALVTWAALCAIALMIYGKAQFNTGTLLLILNALALTVASLSIGFLVGKFIRSHGAQGAITNVIALGMSFLGGVFVPQEMLGESVKTVASFTPVYWYVKGVLDIQSTVVYNTQNILPIVYSILIQAGFAAAILIIALVISKQRKLANAYS